ncbi:MAG: hypothetical protein KAS01_01695 [Candidatus Pacebacteria bacterium]|nr:hypothetical protein [Candidatus Paceibacterota bacterium]
MKKIIIIGFLATFILFGYVWQNSNRQNENNKISGNNRFADFERPEEKVDISGIVKTVIGNEVTVLKIERRAFAENNNTEEGDENIDNQKEQRPASGTGGGMGMGMGMGGAQLNTETNDVDIAARLEILKSMSTEEEKVIIPVGVKMLKNENGEMIEATLNDITKDKMLMIWIDVSITEKNVANFVIIN